MTLLLSEPGVLRNALATRLGCSSSEVATPNDADADLFALATGKRVIVYLAAPNLLEASLEPKPEIARIRRALGASNAPGVESLVVLVPRGDGYRSELDTL